MVRIVFRLLADTALIALLLFVPAGTIAWWRAWVLLTVLFATRPASAVVVYRRHPVLLRERARLPLPISPTRHPPYRVLHDGWRS